MKDFIIDLGYLESRAKTQVGGAEEEEEECA